MGLMFFADRSAALDEVRRVLRTGGRFVVNTPGPMQPLFEILDRALADHIDPDLGRFLRAVFSLHDADGLAAVISDAGFDDVEVHVRRVTLDLRSPTDFLWDYLGSTPLAPFLASATDQARRALADDVVEQWQVYVGDDGRLQVTQPVLYSTSRAP
jgi:hypothetical protein